MRISAFESGIRKSLDKRFKQGERHPITKAVVAYVDAVVEDNMPITADEWGQLLQSYPSFMRGGSFDGAVRAHGMKVGFDYLENNMLQALPDRETIREEIFGGATAEGRLPEVKHLVSRSGSTNNRVMRVLREMVEHGELSNPSRGVYFLNDK